METRTFDLGEVRLVALEAGRGGRPLLLVHGYTGAKEDFLDWIEPLADLGWHVVAPDNRGHGDSDKPEGEEQYSLEIFARDKLALADALGWDRFTLLGHSMGGMLSQVLVLGARERVEALILMDTSHGPFRAVDAETVELAVGVARTQGMAPIADLIAQLQDPLDSPAWQAVLARRPELGVRADRNLRIVSPHMYATMLIEITSQEDRLDDLRSLDLPTLVLVGDQDTPFLKPSRRMADAIPGAQFVEIPDSGHSPQLEAAEAWFAAVSSFLGGL